MASALLLSARPFELLFSNTPGLLTRGAAAKLHGMDLPVDEAGVEKFRKALSGEVADKDLAKLLVTATLNQPELLLVTKDLPKVMP